MSENSAVSWWYWFYQLYKWLIFMPLFLVSSVVCAILAALFSIMVSPNAGDFWGKAWAKITCWITPVKVNVHGRKNVSPGQSYVIVANHQTGFDIFMLYGYLGIYFKWIMKKELRKIPFIGFASEKVGHIFIDRTSPRHAMQSLEEARNKLTGGTSVVIFPEGTRSESEKMKPFKRGAFKLALDLRLPILPVTIVNSWRIKRRGFLNIMPGKTALVIHPPIETSGFINKPEELMDLTRKAIKEGNHLQFTR
ncbi:lysophospholipid acyltransferase family protein [Thermophagus sp. OGC60D27]|uniref:lysophospholipid acyltransferase family protein n=1 Tax=Thermophagus sp. OGC60D27 TaxID=3458415 RepID=UPI0040377016